MLLHTPTIGERPRNYRGGRRPTYRNLYERLVANTTLSREDDPSSCWLWTCACDRYGYPRIGFRTDDGRVKKFYAHRLMLELSTGFQFPYDEAGHLCGNPSCINPSHLEIQTKSFNLSERRGYMAKKPGCFIPTLFPIDDPLQLTALEDDIPFFDIGIPVTVGDGCPF